MTEESEATSLNASLNNSQEQEYSSVNESTFSESSQDMDSLARVQIVEDMKHLEQISEELFKVQRIPFKFDVEDFEHRKLNGEVKKIIHIHNLTLPIIQIKSSNKYLIAAQFVHLELNGVFIHVRQLGNEEEPTLRLTDYLDKYEKYLQSLISFYNMRSGWPITKIVQSLIDGKAIFGVTPKDLKIFNSYSDPRKLE
mmetsp:Transcript_7471/g.12629  ORF Transcript_7471/g.12629 Transcript_7471/m.12629 type:complete len:197 (-) Transcript_7471:3-593(-)